MRVQNGNTITFTGDLEQNKSEALEMIKSRFENDLKERQFVCSLGFPVQNRRFETKNDLQNIDSLIYLGVTYFRDANDINQNVTIPQLELIKSEMIADGLQMYQSKFDAETQIENCTTIPEVWDLIG